MSFSTCSCYPHRFPYTMVFTSVLYKLRVFLFSLARESLSAAERWVIFKNLPSFREVLAGTRINMAL